MLTAALDTLIAAGMIKNAIGWLILLVTLSIKIRNEETLLSNNMPMEYEQYYNEVTARLVPFLV